MKKTLALVVAATTLLAACGGAAAATEEKAATFETISPHQAAALIEGGPDDLVVLDLRTSEEVAAGRIDGSDSLDFYRPDFTEQLDALDKDVPYLVYCRSGNRSGQAVQMMGGLGFGEVYEIEGGIVDWSKAGFAVSTS